MRTVYDGSMDLDPFLSFCHASTRGFGLVNKHKNHLQSRRM